MSKSGGFSLKRTVCASATVALLASALTAGVAHADDSELFYGNIDGAKKGTLTLHKFESGSLTGTATAAGGQNPQGDGIDGVTFKVHAIDADLTTVEGWTTISKVTTVPVGSCNDDGSANFNVLGNGLQAKASVPSKEKATASGGNATFDDLSVGAYLVCEKKLSAGETATNTAGNPVTVVTRSAPFIVTVPRPHENGTGDNKGWIYDVHAYPKNTVTEAPKKAVTVAEDKWAINADEALTYTITAKVPSLLTEHFAYYSVIDHYSPSLADVTVKTVQVGDETFSTTTDYVVDSSIDNHRVVNFTKAGLLKLEGKKNHNIVVTLTAKVANVPVGDPAQKRAGRIDNEAFIAVKTSPDAPQDEPTTPINAVPLGGVPEPKDPKDPMPSRSNTVKTTWGDVKIRKYDAAQPNAGLKGATFEVFKPQDEQACKQAATQENKNAAISGAAVTSGSTADNGELTIAGLFVGKAEAGDPETERCYVVRETVPPVGYVLPAEDQRTFAVIVKAGVTATGTYDLSVANTKVSVPALPLTGASGRLLLMVGGLALVLASMGVVMVIRKRSADA